MSFSNLCVNSLCVCVCVCVGLCLKGETERGAGEESDD